MKYYKSIFILGSIALILNGCWIALPADGPSGAKEHIGQTYKLQRDILIVSYWLTPISCEVNDKDTIGKRQKILATLKIGSELKIESIKVFRIPSGVHYAYRCVDIKSEERFDLSFKMIDCIGLSIYRLSE